jgi:hypothetical protein
MGISSGIGTLGLPSKSTEKMQGTQAVRRILLASSGALLRRVLGRTALTGLVRRPLTLHRLWRVLFGSIRREAIGGFAWQRTCRQGRRLGTTGRRRRCGRARDRGLGCCRRRAGHLRLAAGLRWCLTGYGRHALRALLRPLRAAWLLRCSRHLDASGRRGHGLTLPKGRPGQDGGGFTLLRRRDETRRRRKDPRRPHCPLRAGSQLLLSARRARGDHRPDQTRLGRLDAAGLRGHAGVAATWGAV